MLGICGSLVCLVLPPLPSSPPPPPDVAPRSFAEADATAATALSLDWLEVREAVELGVRSVPEGLSTLPEKRIECQ